MSSEVKPFHSFQPDVEVLGNQVAGHTDDGISLGKFCGVMGLMY